MSKSHRAKSAPARRHSRKHLKSRRKNAPGKMQPVLSPKELKERFEKRKRIALQLSWPLQRRQGTRAVHRMSTGGKSRRKSRKPRKPRKPRRKSDGGCFMNWLIE